MRAAMTGSLLPPPPAAPLLLPPPAYVLTFEALSYEVPIKRGPEAGSTKAVLTGVSGRASSGRLLALMGPSGAGKTSLVGMAASWTVDARVSSMHCAAAVHVKQWGGAAGSTRAGTCASRRLDCCCLLAATPCTARAASWTSWLTCRWSAALAGACASTAAPPARAP